MSAEITSDGVRPVVAVRPEPRPARSGALDGLRGIAIIAVLAYHLAPARFPGGFLGVDVFFALSGYLVTRSLIRDQVTVRTAVRFYRERAQRLVPALFVVLAATWLLTRVVRPQELYRLRGDLLSGLTFSTNLTQIWWDRGYFEQLGQPSLTQHLWSLAVEGQFYLLWPLTLIVLLGVAKLSRHDGYRWTAAAVVVIAVLSLMAMATAFDATAGPARVYYGTDTHCASLLLGAGVALRFASSRPRHGSPPSPVSRRTAWQVTGAITLSAFAAAVLTVHFAAPELYRGGYVAVAAGAAALVASARQPGLFSRVLGTRVLAWFGQRCYGIYLWHWPLILLTGPDMIPAVNDVVRVSIQLAGSIVLGELSWRFVERPAYPRLSRTARTAGPVAADGRRPAILISVLAGGAAVALAVPSVTRPPGIEVDTAAVRPTLNGAAATSNPPAAVTTASAAPTQATPSPTALPPFAAPVRVTLFGDSQGHTMFINRPDGLDRSITLADRTVQGCGALLGIIVSSVDYQRDLTAECRNWPQAWQDGVTDTQPQIAVVQVGAWDVFDVILDDGSKLAFGSPQWDSNYRSQLEQGIQILLAAGAQVGLLEVPCYRPIAAGGLPLLPERGDDSRTRHVNAVLAQVAAQHPGRVFVLSSPAAFCNDPAVSTNTSYRWDGLHYYIPGAFLQFQTLVPQLLAVPQPA